MVNFATLEFDIDGRHAAPAFAPALLFSLTVHAAVGALLFHALQRAPIEPPQTMTVTMVEAAPVQTPVVEMPPAPPRTHRHEPFVPQRAPQLVQNVQHVPAPETMVVERAAAAPVVTAPVVETPPASAVVAKVAVAPGAPTRAEVIEPPHFNVAYLNNPRPAYPPMARRLGIEGLVVLRVQVSAKGTPDQVAVAQTSGTPVLDEAALRAVQGWSFVPARLGEKPIAHVVDVPVRFQLKN
jgi:periplasmic protein TonB